MLLEAHDGAREAVEGGGGGWRWAQPSFRGGRATRPLLPTSICTLCLPAGEKVLAIARYF